MHASGSGGRQETCGALPRRGGAPGALLGGLLAGVLVGTPGIAQAQGIDAHGPVPPPVEGRADAPLTLWSPHRAPKGAWTVGGLLELVDRPLVRYEWSALGEPPTEVPVVGSAVVLGLSGRYTLGRRVALGASVPLFLHATGEAGAGGPALGDVHLWVPIGLKIPEDGQGLGFSLVPWLDLATGQEARFLGDPNGKLGLLGAIGYGRGAWSFVGNLGLEVGEGVSFPHQVVGGSALILGGAVGYAVNPRLGLHLEGRVSAGPEESWAAVAGAGATGSPAELLLTVKGRFDRGPWYVGGLGRGVSKGIGAGRARGFVGFGWSHDPTVADGPDLPRGGWELVVRDPRGEPVRGASLQVAGKQVAVTGADGVIAVDGLRWRKGVEVQAPGHLAIALDPPEEEQTAALELVLPWAPRPVPFRVISQEGRLVPAQLVAHPLSEASEAEPVTAPSGSLRLEPGRWRVEIEAEGFAAQAREIEVPAGQRALVETEVVLLEPAGEATLVHRIADTEGASVVGARVLLDGQPVGTTGEGGLIELASLAVGPHRLIIQHEAFTQREEPELVLGPGENLIATVLHRVPGSVKVVVRDRDGRVVPDAVVRFDGPRRLAPMPLGERGERTTVLGPGTWTLLVTSATWGIQEREVVVPPDNFDLITAEVVLQPQEQGRAELAVRVIDPEGHPIDGAELTLDGQPLGRTSTGGTLRLSGLRAGIRTLGVVGEHFRPLSARDLRLAEGLHEELVTLDWQPGSVLVLTRQPEGVVDDAVVRFLGEERLPPAPLGPAGEGLFQLPEGPWQVLVTSARHGLQARDLVIPPDSRALQVVDVVMNPTEGGLATLDLRVANTEGHAVVGAEVRLDGLSLGRTTNTGILALNQLSVGRRELAVEAPLYQPQVRDHRLLEGRQELELVLDWAPGATRVKVVGPDGEPVTDATVRLLGPGSVPPARVDPHGEQHFQLTPGRWQALVVSERFGIAQVPVEIGRDEVLTEVTVALEPVEAGLAELLVRVVDDDGRPVVGARVTLDGQEIGPTGDGGALLVQELPPGVVRLGLRADRYANFSTTRVDLREGSQERIFRLAFQPGTVTVSVQDRDGRPVDAEVRLVGPTDVPPFRTGADGVEPVALRPGTWQVIASTEALGPERAEVTVAPGASVAQVELVLEPTRVHFTDEAVLIRERVAFDFDRDVLRPDSAAVLDEVANTILSRAHLIRVEVQGHTDNVGSVAYNQDLSQRRAEAVVRALVARGVPPEKLRARGYGTQRPIADNDTDEGRAANRRVEFQIVEQAVEP